MPLPLVLVLVVGFAMRCDAPSCQVPRASEIEGNREAPSAHCRRPGRFHLVTRALDGRVVSGLALSMQPPGPLMRINGFSPPFLSLLVCFARHCLGSSRALVSCRDQLTRCRGRSNVVGGIAINCATVMDETCPLDECGGGGWWCQSRLVVSMRLAQGRPRRRAP